VTRSGRASAIACALAFALAGRVGAIGLGVQPGRLELVMKPGESRQLTFEVVNTDGHADLRAHFYVTDVVQAPDGSADLVEPGTTAWSATGWVALRTVALVVGPHARAPVLYEVRVPKTARGSGYVALVAESTVPARASAESAARIVVRIPFLLHVRVAGTEIWKARVRSLKPSTLTAGERVRWSCSVKNEGNVLIRPVGTLSIRAAGAKGRILAVNAPGEAVFPGQTKTFEVDDPKGVRRAGFVTVGLALDSGESLRLETGETFTFTQ
jgi:hypothetical protein